VPTSGNSRTEVDAPSLSEASGLWFLQGRLNVERSTFLFSPLSIAKIGDGKFTNLPLFFTRKFLDLRVLCTQCLSGALVL